MTTSFHGSPWSSPEPYFSGVLAGILGITAIALLLLLCSCLEHFSLSDFIESRRRRRRGGMHNMRETTQELVKIPQPLEKKVVVIMAGEENPSYIATPASIDSSSLGGNKIEQHKGTQKTENENEESQMGVDEGSI
ncbi:hypothetical protein MRB53_028122 [Persea americana]|uniref:Uncharacterized protein n=1 Tax=Persea americana TaxID=3435 RepID=A0ACC2KEV4_PERAE|nr:hypothetical protein MRB53_028122 [Persea americana]